MTDRAVIEDYNDLSDDEFRVVARRFVEQHYPAELRNPLRLAGARLAARARRHGALGQQISDPD